MDLALWSEYLSDVFCFMRAYRRIEVKLSVKLPETTLIVTLQINSNFISVYGKKLKKYFSFAISVFGKTKIFHLY